MSQTVPSTLVNTPKTNVSCGTDLSGQATHQSSGSDLVETSNQEVCGSTIYVGDVAAGVESVKVGETLVDGVVEFQGSGGTSLSLSGQVVTVTSGNVSNGVQWMAQLLDVVLPTDETGRTDVPDGATLVFNANPADPNNGFWTHTTVHDGGSY